MFKPMTVVYVDHLQPDDKPLGYREDAYFTALCAWYEADQVGNKPQFVNFTDWQLGKERN